MFSEELSAKLRDLGLLVLRLAMAVPLFAFHGYDKWIHFAERAPKFPDPLGVGKEFSLMLAVFGEVICALLVVAGLATRLAAAVIAILFAVIVFGVDAGKPWGEVELALIYGLMAVAISMTGAGRISVDAALEFTWRD